MSSGYRGKRLKLIATVVEVTDLGQLYPTSILNDRFCLDVRIDRGSLSIGKKIRLSGQGAEEEVEIVGMEMLSNPYDPNLVRILCSKPKYLALPNGKIEGLSISED